VPSADRAPPESEAPAEPAMAASAIQGRRGPWQASFGNGINGLHGAIRWK
jgi:hypothetical protein